MKIVNREEFLKLEEPVLYLKCDKNGNPESGLCIKYNTMGNDFCNLDLHLHIRKSGSNESCADCSEEHDVLDNALMNNESFEYDYTMTGRDGLYDNHQLFIIYEKVDMLSLMKELNNLYNCKYHKDEFGNYFI